MLRLVALVVLFGMAFPARADERTVAIRFLGGSKKVPLDGLKVTIRAYTGDWSADMKKKLIDGTTNKEGAVSFNLTDGQYYVEITSRKELPYLDRPVGFKTPPNLYSRMIKVERVQTFEFNLADACQLVLRAIDADSGKPIAGVSLVTESETAEQWGIPILGDNLGANHKREEKELTDKNGYLVRFMGPREGYTYFAWPAPDGYRQLGKLEVSLPTPIGGKDKVEHVFKFQKK